MSIGDGTTSEGEVWEALNTACNLKLPVIFLVEDNGYAISVPVEVGVAGGDISQLVSGFPNLYIQKCDGTDPLESYETFKRAVEYCRAKKGPAFVHAKVIRPYSHSLSDDEKLYRPAEEREQDAAVDPIKTYAEFLMTEGMASSEELEEVRAKRLMRKSTKPRMPRWLRRSPRRKPRCEMFFRPTSIRPTESF